MIGVQERSKQHPGVMALILAAALTAMVTILLTTLELEPRFFVGLVMGSVLGFIAYSAWQPDSPRARTDLRRAAIVTLVVVLVSVAAAVLYI